MDLSQIEKISKALADETRLMIFQAISCQKHMNCSQIVSLQEVTPATVSHHLKILVEAGLVQSRREGQFVYNQAIPGKIEEYTRALTSIARGKKAAKQRKVPSPRSSTSRVRSRSRTKDASSMAAV